MRRRAGITVSALRQIAAMALWASLPASALAAADEMSLIPATAQPGQSVRIIGAPEAPEDPRVVGSFPGAGGEDAGPLRLLTQRDREGELVFLVPLPADPDRRTTLRVRVEGDERRSAALELAITPLEPAPGATRRLLELAEETLTLEAERAGVDPGELDAALRSEPDRVPGHLLATGLARALGRALRQSLSDGLTGAQSERIDALVASWGFLDLLRARRDWSAAADPAPVEGADGSDAGEQEERPRSRGLLDWLFPPAYAATPVTLPWEHVEIDTASELDYWMRRRLEYIERTPPGSPERRKLQDQIREDLASTAEESAKEFADGYFKKEKSRLSRWLDESTEALHDSKAQYESHKRMVKGYRKVLGSALLAKQIIDATIELNDRLRIATLPSDLVSFDLTLKPPVFSEEDDLRGNPSHADYGRIDARLTASSGRFELTLSDVAELAEIGISGHELATGDDVAGFLSDAHDFISRVAEYSDIVREEARAQRDEGLSDAGTVWVVEPETWSGIKATEPKYAVLSEHPGMPPAVRVFEPSPVRWGYRPLEARRSKLRIRTALDKFPGSPPAVGEAWVEVEAIDVDVVPGEPDVVPEETRTFSCPLNHAEDELREWRAKEGRFEAKLEARCLSDNCPTASWTAPKLPEDECERKTVLSCEAMTTQGIRVDRNPPRVGTSTVRVRRPGPLSISPSSKRVDPGETVRLEARDAGDATVGWRLVEGRGRVQRTGPRSASFVSEAATKAVVEAFAPEEEESCRPTAEILVGSGDHRYFGWVRGDVGAARLHGRRDQGPLEYCGGRGCAKRRALEQALKRNSDLYTYVLHEMMPMMQGVPLEELQEKIAGALASATSPPGGGKDSSGCGGGRYLGRREVDRKDLSEVGDEWHGEPIRQGVSFRHQASDGRRRLSGSVSVDTQARLVESTPDSATFEWRFNAKTRGQNPLVRGGMPRPDCLGNDGEAYAIHTWGWVVETAEPVSVAVDLELDATGDAQVQAFPAVMLVLDGEVLALSGSFGGGFEPVIVSNVGQALGGVEQKLRERLAEMDPEQRAMAEQMMGPGGMEEISEQMDAAKEMVDTSASATIDLPGPPPGQESITYYLLTSVHAEMDRPERTDDHRWSGESRASVRARMIKGAKEEIEDRDPLGPR